MIPGGGAIGRKRGARGVGRTAEFPEGRPENVLGKSPRAACTVQAARWVAWLPLTHRAPCKASGCGASRPADLGGTCEAPCAFRCLACTVLSPSPAPGHSNDVDKVAAVGHSYGARVPFARSIDLSDHFDFACLSGDGCPPASFASSGSRHRRPPCFACRFRQASESARGLARPS